MLNRDARAAHRAADDAEEAARQAPVKLALARFQLEQDRHRADLARLAKVQHGHVFH